LDSRLPPVPSGPLNHRGRGAVWAGTDGKSDFDRLHSHAHDEQVFLYAFDLLELNGEDYRQHPLEQRKVKLEQMLA
jgi:ATP-dependent DNA ligase